MCAWEQRERLDLSLVPALQDQMHACTRVTTELLPSSRCRQHHLLPRLTTDFLAHLPQKARERASMSDARQTALASGVSMGDKWDDAWYELIDINRRPF